MTCIFTWDVILPQLFCTHFAIPNQLHSFCTQGLFIWEKLSGLGGEIIPARSRHNANFHLQKSSIHMNWKFPRLTEISPTFCRFVLHLRWKMFLRNFVWSISVKCFRVKLLWAYLFFKKKYLSAALDLHKFHTV